MKNAYPIVMTEGKEKIIVYVPDFEINTQGDDYANALEMARDAIGLVGIDIEDDGEILPIPSKLFDIAKKYADATISLVDVDFSAYRRKNDMRTVRRNVTLPAWLDEKASEANINVSAVLKSALTKELNIEEHI